MTARLVDERRIFLYVITLEWSTNGETGQTVVSDLMVGTDAESVLREAVDYVTHPDDSFGEWRVIGTHIQEFQPAQLERALYLRREDKPAPHTGRGVEVSEDIQFRVFTAGNERRVDAIDLRTGKVYSPRVTSLAEHVLQRDLREQIEHDRALADSISREGEK